MNATARLLIERECERLILDYCHFVDYGEASKISSLFTEAGIWQAPEVTWTSRKEILAGFQLREARRDRISRHVMSNVRVDVVDATHARGSSYFTLWRYDGAENPRFAPLDRATAVGDYLDEFELTNDGWRIAKRIADVTFAAASL